jgi:hypothetical protein
MTDTESLQDKEPRDSVKVIGIPDSDLDRPLYRIFPLWFFEYALRVNGGSLVLVRPQRWDDPHEDPCMNIMMCAPDYTQKHLAAYLKPVYAQCWSFEGKSDALLRAYSRVSQDGATKRNVEPKYEGVQVRTTPRKLIAALNAFSNKRADLNLDFYLGAVRYIPDPAQEITNRLNQIGPRAISQGSHRACSLLLKREAFRHESEVRIILQGAPDIGSEPFHVEVNPNELFDEVRFDSRLALFELRERERLARDLGYNGSIPETGGIYDGVMFEVHLSRHWNDF